MDDFLLHFFETPYESISFDSINAEFDSLYSTTDFGDQVEFAYAIENMLRTKAPDMPQKSPKLYDAYLGFATLLKFRSIMLLSTKEQADLFQRKVLYALQKGLTVQTFITPFSWYYENPKTRDTELKNLLELYKNNLEKLGAMPLEIEGTKYIPQLKNWLLDYIKFPTLSARRGSVEQINYLNKSPNTRQLTQSYRQLLLEALNLFDTLNKPLDSIMQFHTDAPVFIDSDAMADQVVRDPALLDITEQAGPRSIEVPVIVPIPVPITVSPANIVKPVLIDVHEQKLSAPVPELDLPAPKVPEVVQQQQVSPVTPTIVPIPKQASHPFDISKDHQPIPEPPKVAPMPKPVVIDIPKPAAPMIKEQPKPDKVMADFVPPVHPTDTATEILNRIKAVKPSPDITQKPSPKPEIVDEPSSDKMAKMPLTSLMKASDFSRLTAEMLHGTDPYKRLQIILDAVGAVSKHDRYLLILQNIEQSPLQKAYVRFGLQHMGLGDIVGADPSENLTRVEFEAYTDFRKELDQTLV